MHYLTYLFFRFNVLLFRILPFRLIHGLSDMMFFVLYYLLGYRRTVVMNNLKNSFPGKSEEELNIIARKFYHHLTDVLLESMKGYSMESEEIDKRYRLLNPSLVNSFADLGKSVICLAGHYGNWEWPGLTTDLAFTHRLIGFYKPMSNKYIDDYVARHRTRGRNMVASIEDTIRTFKEYNSPDVTPSLFYMIADQSPPSLKMVSWVQFMNQNSAVITGPERYARMLNLPAVFLKVKKIKRSQYTVEFVIIAEDPASTEPGFITSSYMKLLEECIKEQPEYYLWSHRRWKHSKPAETPAGKNNNE